MTGSIDQREFDVVASGGQCLKEVLRNIRTDIEGTDIVVNPLDQPDDEFGVATQ